ncbi:hypothetical protein CIPAW_08G079900 [Carya illinoinensis]|uniref:Uncharacterized protein n=1 Tax=Carya illinoinensis TaxID=32201 RepID=A0A8T1PK66_CARIL|nr:hypothetical protein CIPAW_08G079900 [Carya illinoinensis]
MKPWQVFVDSYSYWAGGEDIWRYLNDNEVPDNKEIARKTRYQATRYTIVDEMLYRKGVQCPLLRCISREQAQHVLAEIHERIYGDHAKGRMLAGKATRVGYY